MSYHAYIAISLSLIILIVWNILWNRYCYLLYWQHQYKDFFLEILGVSNSYFCFRTRGSTGSVKLNGITRDKSPRFRKLSAYIPQEDVVRLALTVKEAMTFAVHLKLGYNVSNDYKIQKVSFIFFLYFLLYRLSYHHIILYYQVMDIFLIIVNIFMKP